MNFHWTNFHWMRSNEFPLVLLAIAVAIVGILTTLVMQQQHNQSTVNLAYSRR